MLFQGFRLKHYIAEVDNYLCEAEHSCRIDADAMAMVRRVLQLTDSDSALYPLLRDSEKAAQQAGLEREEQYIAGAVMLCHWMNGRARTEAVQQAVQQLAGVLMRTHPAVGRLMEWPLHPQPGVNPQVPESQRILPLLRPLQAAGL